ncbi:hypothetical protein [Ruminiclostridium cellobioparum]|uniref:hypothetical protein n=1 Tax=Ruminiclostridium cellobioparum TaxID=29355 RepID=UPI0004800AE9|nr:hypothetical protein [Ruminiclostridium cellobioparum]
MIEDRDDVLAREIIRENTARKDPEITLIEDFTDEIDMRMDQIKIFYPIMELLRKRKTDQRYIELIPELCFLVLAYLIYEGKLKHRGLTFDNVEAFVSKALKRIYISEPEPEISRDLAFELLDGLQNGGRNFVQNTFSFKGQAFREKYIKFIEIKQTENGSLQYFITEQGVDFYLKTKEFPEETKITINLLLFQKQMEKGAFSFAYETVRRLNMEVQKKKDKKYTLLETLMYGEMDSGEEYMAYHRSIVQQFQEESELFNVAINNVQSAFGEYIDRINDGKASDKELRSFTLIKIIEKEIGRAQTLHTELLKEAVSFTREYDNVLGLRRKAIFTEKFNFQREFERLVSHNENPELLKYIFEPLISPNIRKSFNLLRILEPQSVVKSRQENNAATDEEKDSDRATVDDITRVRVKDNFIFYAARLLEALIVYKELDLKHFCSLLVKKNSEASVYNGDFISFVIELNRNKDIGRHVRTISLSDVFPKTDDDMKTIEEIFTRAMYKVKAEGRINRITVTSYPDEDVELLPGLKITNMIFKA